MESEPCYIKCLFWDIIKTMKSFYREEVHVMSEENKNKNKDKGKQRNAQKYNTEPKKDVEFASESEFLNLDGKKNKRMR